MSLLPPRDLYQYRGHVQSTAPAAEPVTVTELRDYLRETATGLPDSVAEDLIAEAREMIENNTGLALITQEWTLALDHWPNGASEPWWDGVQQGAISELYSGRYARSLDLPRYPLQAVDSVTVYDEASNSTSVTVSTVFDVDTYRTPGRITLKSGQTWPVALRAQNAIIVVYTSGYGDASTDVPAALRRAVKQVAAYLYTHRGDECDMGDALAQAGSILDQYMVRRV
jgi:uncharacterized phiE125 gp8 family phage protein